MSLSSVIRYIRALDSAATDGSGKPGIAFGSFTAKYLTEGGVLTSLTTETITTLGTYQAPTSAAHIRIKELANADPTKGAYEVHFHNTQVLKAGKKLWLFLSASGAAIQPLEMDLIDVTGLDLPDGTEVGLTTRESDRLQAAESCGKVSGAGTASPIVFRNAVADTKPRITATGDSSGNRSAITYDAT